MGCTSRMVSSWSTAASGRATATMASRDIAPRMVLIACGLRPSPAAAAAAPCTSARTASSPWTHVMGRQKGPVPCCVHSIGYCTLEGHLKHLGFSC